MHRMPYIIIVPENPLMAYPLLASKVLPHGLLGIFIVSLFAIIMSTIDSMSFVNAITFGRDIVWRKRPKQAKKIISDTYQDLGQGLMDIIYELEREN